MFTNLLANLTAAAWKARAVRESCERVAMRASCNAVKLIDARSRRLKKDLKAQEQDGPFAVAAWLSQEVLSIIHLVLEDLMVTNIAIESWNEQESEYKMSKKANAVSEKKKFGDETGLGKVSEERLRTIEEDVGKEQRRRDINYDRHRKGGRMHAIIFFFVFFFLPSLLQHQCDQMP